MDNTISSFADRHRCQWGIDIIAEPDRLRVEPKGLPVWGVVAWMIFVHRVIVGFLVFKVWRANPDFVLVFIGVMSLEFPTLIGLLFALNRAELAKGPLLEIQKSQRVVVLFRDHRTIKFDDIEAVFVLVGWYEWTDWEQVAEMSLNVSDGDGGIEWFPVILHNQIATVEGLAERVAGSIGRPVGRSRITWGGRQRRTTTRG